MKKLLAILLALAMLACFGACEKIEPDNDVSEEELTALIDSEEEELTEIIEDETAGEIVELPEADPEGEVFEEPESGSDASEVPEGVIELTDTKQLPPHCEAVVDAVLADIEASGGGWALEMDSAVLTDFDGDGWLELAALYSPDGVTLYAVLARQAEDVSSREYQQYVCDLAGAAAAEIWSGELAGEPVLHIVYTNSDGEEPFGSDVVVSLADGGIQRLCELSWTGADFAGAAVADGTGAVVSEDAERFRSIWDTREFRELSFPAEEGLGKPLDQLFDGLTD